MDGKAPAQGRKFVSSALEPSSAAEACSQAEAIEYLPEKALARLASEHAEQGQLLR